MRISSSLVLSCFAIIVPLASAQVPTVAVPPVPQNVVAGGGITVMGKGDTATIYVVCGSDMGAGTTPMYRYDRAGRTWTADDAVRMAMPAGSFLTSVAPVVRNGVLLENQHLYTTEGSSMHVNFFGTEVFRLWGYDPANVQIPKWYMGAGVCEGHYGPTLPAAAVYSSDGRDSVFVLCGGAPGIDYAMTVYAPDNNGGGLSWRNRFPKDLGAGTTLASPWPSNGFLYTTEGKGTKGFWKHDLRYNTWTQIKDVPEAVGTGGALSAGPDGSLLCLTGTNAPTEASPGFYRYDPATDAWTALAALPGPASAGGAGVAWVPGAPGTTGDEVFVLKGGGTPTVWQYSVMDNAFGPRPAAPTRLVQRDSASGDEIALLGNTPNTSVTFEGGPIGAEIVPAGLDVEVQPLGTPFSGTPTVRGPLVFLEGANASATVTGLTAEGLYWWRARYRTQAGQLSNWKRFSPGTTGDFRRKANEAPTAGTARARRASDGMTVADGAVLNDIDGGIRFEGSATDPDLNSVRLQIRIRLLGSAWPAFGAPSAESQAVPSGQAASCTLAPAPGEYEWDSCYVDSQGAKTAWQSETIGSSPARFSVLRNGSMGTGACAGSSAGLTGSMWAVAGLLLFLRGGIRPRGL